MSLLPYTQLPALNVKIPVPTSCKSKSDPQTNPPQSFTNAAVMLAGTSGGRDKGPFSKFNFDFGSLCVN